MFTVFDFYRVGFPGQPPEVAVVVAEDSEASILLRWVPNTGLWHRATELENDYLHGDEGGTYTPLTAQEAGRLLGQVPRLDRRRAIAARMLQRYTAQPASEKRTNAEMGLGVKDTGLKPMSAPGLPQLLQQAARHRQWRTISLYGPGTGSAARQFLSTWDHRPIHPHEPPLELKTTTTGQTTTIQARHVSKTAQGTPPPPAAAARSKTTASASAPPAGTTTEEDS